MEAVRAAAAVTSPGLVRGFGLTSILQLMNWERRSATLTVKGAQGTGFMYVREGDLVHAALGKEEGLMAAYQLLSWDDVQVEFVYTCKIRPTIDCPLSEILMNLALFRDTKARPAAIEREPTDNVWHG
jgi:hypothetical protein